MLSYLRMKTMPTHPLLNHDNNNLHALSGMDAPQISSDKTFSDRRILEESPGHVQYSKAPRYCENIGSIDYQFQELLAIYIKL